MSAHGLIVVKEITRTPNPSGGDGLGDVPLLRDEAADISGFLLSAAAGWLGSWLGAGRDRASARRRTAERA